MEFVAGIYHKVLLHAYIIIFTVEIMKLFVQQSNYHQYYYYSNISNRMKPKALLYPSSIATNAYLATL
jgi:hypothetical protein